jgi:hypothetical protein
MKISDELIERVCSEYIVYCNRVAPQEHPSPDWVVAKLRPEYADPCRDAMRELIRIVAPMLKKEI